MMKSSNKNAGEATTKRQESVIAQSGSDLKKYLRFDEGMPRELIKLKSQISLKFMDYS